MEEKRRIITNHHRYFPVYGYELPKKEFKWWLDLIDKDELEESEFIFYRGSWYPLFDCTRIDKNMLSHFPELKGYTGYWDDTYFSLIVCKYNQEDESYTMGLFM